MAEYKPKKFIAKMEHEADGKKMVNALYEFNKHIGSNAGTTINTLLTEFLTENEVRAALLKIVNRNKGARELLDESLLKMLIEGNANNANKYKAENTCK